MEPGCYVINLHRPELGTGKVIKNDGKSIKVYFGAIDEDKEYRAADNALKKVKDRAESTSSTLRTKMSLEERAKRDAENAHSAKALAREALRNNKPFKHSVDITQGMPKDGRLKEQYDKRSYESLQSIHDNPFHAMVEAEVETKHRGKLECKKQLIYANEYAGVNSPLGADDKRVNILAWTHPCIQLGLSHDLKEEIDIEDRGYTIRSIKPLARAKFAQVLPDVSGLYEPGGFYGKKKERQASTGLTAVKLQMTKEQVHAFLSKMNGMMLVTGAPGSGKTTVAMQRIRFLIDQQELRVSSSDNVRYATELTKVFLANKNLISYSKELLEKDLLIPSSVVEYVDDFIARYLNEIWIYKHNASLRRKKLYYWEERARLAFFGLCSDEQLQDCWRTFEEQIADRLRQAPQASWANLLPITYKNKFATHKLTTSLEGLSSTRSGAKPQGSRLTMDAVYGAVGREYEMLRNVMRPMGDLEKFDLEFQKWLYWVYDPFDALISYFEEDMYAGGVRIKRGTASKINEANILQSIRKDWKSRSYGREEIPWLAFLLRFVLPEANDHQARFREMPNPLAIAGKLDETRWTHVMVDEAQDLCVAQAALIGSFVHPDGAFTVSADFKQIVSPVWGMKTSNAFKIGISLRDKRMSRPFLFAKNMRQSKQIGQFLQSFYSSVFGEIAEFEVNGEVEGSKPLLYIDDSSHFPALIKQRLNVFSRNKEVHSIALLQVNEDENAMIQIRTRLEEKGVKLAPIWASTDDSGRLVTTSVERIKGLEYDACFVLGLDETENRHLNFVINREYVALSRPARHLAMFCAEMPKSLQKIDPGLMEIIRL